MSAAKSILAFIGGIAIGGITALLLSPNSGKENRKKLLELFEKTKDQILEKIEEAGFTEAKAKEILEKIKFKISELTNYATIEEVIDETLSEEKA